MTRRFSRRWRIFGLLLCLASVSCGRRGDPIPPGARIYDAPSSLKITGRNGQLVLSWQAPEAPGGGFRYKVLRSAWPPGSPGDAACVKCPGDMEEVADLDVEELRAWGLPETSWIDPQTPDGWTLKYRVLHIDRNGIPSSPSKPAQIVWRDIPSPRVVAAPGDGLAAISVDAAGWPEELGPAEIRVYGGNDEIIAKAPPGAREASVRNLENNVEAELAVHLVGKTPEGWEIESRGTSVTATPVDSLGPVPPFDLSVEVSPKGVELYWRLGKSSLPAAIVVLRAEGGGAFEEIKKLSPDARVYLDNTVETGKTYRYSLIAEDSGGKQSLPAKDVLINFKSSSENTKK